jgi:hypothetical protein
MSLIGLNIKPGDRIRCIDAGPTKYLRAGQEYEVLKVTGSGTHVRIAVRTGCTIDEIWYPVDLFALSGKSVGKAESAQPKEYLLDKYLRERVKRYLSQSSLGTPLTDRELDLMNQRGITV